MRGEQDGSVALFGSFSRRGVACIEPEYLALVLAAGISKLLAAAEGRCGPRSPAFVAKAQEALVVAEFEARRAFGSAASPDRLARGFRALHVLVGRWSRVPRPGQHGPGMTAAEKRAHAEAELFRRDLELLGLVASLVDPRTGQLPLSALAPIVRLDRAGRAAAQSSETVGRPRRRRNAA